MDMKEAFNTALTGVVTQGRASARPEEVNEATGERTPFTCLYRGPQGTKCAVGWLIPDDEYREKYDLRTKDGGIGIFDLEDIRRMVSTIRDLPEEFLSDLQGAHDSAARIYEEEVDGLEYSRTATNEEFLGGFLKNMQNLSNQYRLGINVSENEAVKSLAHIARQ